MHGKNLKYKKKLIEKKILKNALENLPPKPHVCKACKTGACCRLGVEMDLKEAAKIADLDLNLKKPWFACLFKDESFSSGWGVDTVVRHGRCVFQQKDKKCLIYLYRPTACREFPLEDGKFARYYEHLCSEVRKVR